MIFPDPNWNVEPDGRDRSVYVAPRLKLPTGLTLEYAYDLWAALFALIFLGTMGLLLAGRNRLPGWMKTLLIALAAVSWLNVIRCFVLPILWWQTRAFGAVSGPASITLRAMVLTLLGVLPMGLLFGMPLARVLAGLRRSGVRAWNLIDWITTPSHHLHLSVMRLLDAMCFAFHHEIALYVGSLSQPSPTSRDRSRFSSY